MPYKRIVCLGTGFFGEVWLEEDAALNRQCAAKRLNPARLPPGHVFAEAQAMLGAEHDNVVRVYSADIEAGTPVIRMEYLPAGSIADRYKGEPAPVAEALHAVEEACRGVEALHARGALHRDIKPANLLIGEGERIKVSDFGLACELANLAGAPPWGYTEHLPPEAIAGAGAIDTVAGDVYALGVTLYRLLNGDAMMRGATTPGTDLHGLIAAGKYPNRSRWAIHIHDRLRRVARKAMHPNPDLRYASASELRHALEGSRPAVSWVRAAVGGLDGVWEGVAADGQSRWRARLGANKHGKYVFELERQRPGGQFRRSRADSLTSNTLKEAVAHAVTVLQRLASTGQ